MTDKNTINETNNERKSIFATLREIDLTNKHKEKNGLKYLPWASAWAAVKSVYPLAFYDIVKSPDGNLYSTDGKTCRVSTKVTIEGFTHPETLAVMDNRNNSIPLENITSTAVDKTIKRCLTKNLALFGLDLNLWAGEELSDEAKEIKNEKQKEEEEEKAKEKAALDENIQKIIKTGTLLLNQGVTKETISGVVSKHNEGNKNPSSITSLETCAVILKEFDELKINAAPHEENRNTESKGEESK